MTLQIANSLLRGWRVACPVRDLRELLPARRRLKPAPTAAFLRHFTAKSSASRTLSGRGIGRSPGCRGRALRAHRRPAGRLRIAVRVDSGGPRYRPPGLPKYTHLHPAAPRLIIGVRRKFATSRVRRYARFGAGRRRRRGRPKYEGAAAGCRPSRRAISPADSGSPRASLW